MEMERQFCSVCLGLLLLFGVFSMFFTPTVMDTKESSNDVNAETDGGRSFPMDKNVRIKRDIATIGTLIGLGISLIDFAVGNSRQSSDNSGDKKSHQELIAHFKEIKKELEQQTEELRSINREIQILGLNVIYSKHEEKIQNSLQTLLDYLENPNDRNRNLFIEEGRDLTQSIRVLVDGLLGQRAFKPDIMADMRDVAKCHGRKLRKNVESVGSLILTGFQVSSEYQRMINFTEQNSSSFNEYIETSLTKLKKRFNDMIIECQAGEKNVRDEMRNIMNATLIQDKKTVTDSLIEFLEEKYDTKKWIVVMVKKNSESLDYVATSRFHQVSVQNYVAFAISVDRKANSTEFKNIIDGHMKGFDFPLKRANVPTLPFHTWRCLGSFSIEEYLHRFFIPILAKGGVEMETLVSTDVHLQEFIIATSKGVEELVTSIHNKTEECGKQTLVIVVPITRSAIGSNQSPSTPHLKNLIMECSYDPDIAEENYGPWRNEYLQAYLSAEGDSNEEGVSIILDGEWRNSSGQKWKFVDGQLRNGYDKCLTRWHPLSFISTYEKIYQYNCDKNLDSQKWHRHGLHILDDSKQCLSFQPRIDVIKHPLVATPECDSLPPFLWYNWKTDCDDALVIPSSSTNESRPLRNEFSRLFLSVDDYYGIGKPWISQHPTQLWKFVDGLLMNDDGKCLAGKGWYVQKVECADRMGNNGLWTYNEKQQIISKNGYCLSSGADENGYVYYDYCKDEPRQRWRYFS